MKAVYLKDFKDYVKDECLKRNNVSMAHWYSEIVIDKAIEAQIQNNLHYANGKTFDNYFGVVAEYVHTSDIPVYNEMSEAAKWELSGHVRNSASRISRGLSAI